ncbi:hypothetical protein H5410_001663 [Solanum commersonii]|uniref:Uncharacterized protein n=1 Tax=Solanum commersonii TaxID=4109 RepID=A0A9J6B078_SOLCO|nr:hypothetical protein H5410_001663 [Solanum commersonii]
MRQIFIPDADNTKGIRRSIDVPEMAGYLREEKNIDGDDESKKMILQASISSIKSNTCILICNQLDKIQRLINEKMWSVHHIIVTDVFKEVRKEFVDEAWRNIVLQPCLDIMQRFLKNDDHNIIIECEIELDSDITVEDFFLKLSVFQLLLEGQIRIEKLVEDHLFMFKYKYDSCFIWIDVEQSVLNCRVETRVEEMVYAGVIEPNSDFTAEDFCLKSIVCIELFLKTQCVPIIVGGSNSYIEKLVEDLTQYVPIIVGESNLYIENLLEDPVFMFKYKYDSCFIWIDVEQSILNRRVDTRVDEMVNAVMVNEVRQIFIPNADYSKGNLQSIGVPEMARYLREEKNIDGDDESKKMILQDSISSIERNTRILICNLLDKIQRLINEKMWSVHHIFATDVFKEDRKEAVDEAWRNTVLQPRLDIVIGFLKNDDHNISEIEPYSDFTVEDFCMKSIVYKENCLKTRFFIWIDVEQSVFNCRVGMRVDEMVNEDENDESKKVILQASISSIKHNTRILIGNQLDKIQQLINEKMWSVYHIIAIDVFKEDRKEVVDEAWRNTVLQPYLDIMKRFLKNDNHNIIIESKMNTFINNNNKFNNKKVVFIMGATGTGKYREIEPDSDFTAKDFYLKSIIYI